MDTALVAHALSSETRLAILRWLKDPEASFESQREGDLAPEGVCVSLIAFRAGISQPTASRHLEVLRRAGLVETRRVAQWNFHRRSEAGLRQARELLGDI